MLNAHKPDRKTQQEFLDAAVAVSDAVAGGADPADPAVVALLDDLFEQFQPNAFIGTDGADLASGKPGQLNYLNGLGGDDVLKGVSTTDVLVGGDGDDVLDGNGGDDGLFGGAGDDVILAGSGDDIARGDDGNDIIDGGTGRDTLEGGAGNDTVAGGNGRDTLSGDAGNDILDGGQGNDVLAGGDGTDTLTGGDGNDTLNGNAGVDTITGGAGKDAFVFDGARFNGGNVTDDDGVRQVVNTPDALTDWTIGEDTFVLDTSDFLVTGDLNFFNGLAADIPEGGTNVIVLQNVTDANGAGLNAGTAASLIATNVETSGAGFFIYFNANLQINRLVYSSDLSDPTADISVVANINTLTGQTAIDALPTFSANEFEFIA